MTTAELPRTIRASIHPDALERVSTFFNASAKDILNETLQNARRAGATQVDITSDGENVTVSDNGRGIENPQAILSFGESNWTSESAQREHPAGMGFYALARNPEVTVVSRPSGGEAWQVALTPEHFTGHAEAAVTRPESESPTLEGTAITFQCHGDPVHTVRETSKHYPLPVTYNGEPVEQKDFLEHARYIETWNGIRIGVIKAAYLAEDSNRLNFHGIVIRKLELPTAASLHHRWWVRLDVQDADGLELTLPARRELVETPFTDELRTACAKAIYNAIRVDPEGIDVPYSLQQEARAAGVEIPDARPILRPWRARHADHHATSYQESRITDPVHAVPGSGVLVVQTGIQACDEQALERAANRLGLMPRLVRANAHLEGYGWYDNLTKIVSMKITARYGDTVEEMDDRRNSNQPVLEDVRPDAITIVLETRDRHANYETMELPTDVAFELDEEDYTDEATPLVTKDSDINVDQLSDFILRAWFWPYEESESDSYETQKEYAIIAYTETALRILNTGDEALAKILADAAVRNLNYHIPEDVTAVITLRHNAPPEVEIRRSE